MEVLLLDTCGQRKLKSLLLISLFVGNIAADCLIPEVGQNMIPTTETLLKNDFPDGSQATFECSNGYDKESGSGILTCQDGKWTEPDLTCIRKDCGSPKTQKNMRFYVTGTLFGDVVKISCDEGYKINGASYMQCIVTGWFGSARCDVVTCNKPFQVPNGKSSLNAEENPKYGQTVNYTCDDGYKLIGNSSIACGKTGQYDSQPPECQRVITEDTKMVTSAPTSTEPETLSSTTPSTTRTAAAVPTSEREEDIETINTNKYNALILSVTFISFVAVAAVVLFLLYKVQQRRKGSYDTREDLKPELLQFQNL